MTAFWLFSYKFFIEFFFHTISPMVKDLKWLTVIALLALLHVAISLQSDPISLLDSHEETMVLHSLTEIYVKHAF